MSEIDDPTLTPPTPPTPPPGGHQASTPPPPIAPPGAQVSPNRNLMIVLAYVWILALVPLLAEKDDPEVQWHAKHGLVLTVAELILYVGVFILANIPVIGCAAMILYGIIPLVSLIVRILCIVKGTSGERFLIPGLSHYADQF